ncbi:MAG: hypothetical protein H6767_00245 [Candidatus Peribacteria bacterium]|nr:MAG: hypothetical protein H6767_00245 [Candidatus Peribacteria bacterium]
MNPTQTVEKEEDLLILNDDVHTDVAEPTDALVFDETPNEENIISFDEATEEMETPISLSADTSVVLEDATVTPEENTLVLEELPSDTSASNNEDSFFDLGNESPVVTEEGNTQVETPKEEGTLDLSSLSEEVSSSDSVTTEPETSATSEDAFDFGSFGSGEEAKKDETSMGGSTGDDTTTSISSDAGDVNSILDEAIHKLQARKESITSEQSKKEQHISDLQAQISGLEEEVAGEESGVKDFVTESKKIEENVAQLEKMKLTEDTVKEHNTKRAHKA